MMRFNLKGLLMMVPAVAFGYLIAWLAGQLESNTYIAFVAGFVLIPIDLYLRYKTLDPEMGKFRRWFSIENGGWVGFPIWFLGFGFILLHTIPEGFFT